MPLSVNLKEEFCKQILQLDNSIRFAGIANMKGKLVAEAYREGLVPLLTKQETELSALQAIVKMATRESLEEKKLGKTICAILVNNRPVFFIQIVTPTSEIYSKVNNVFSIQRVEIVSLVGRSKHGRYCSLGAIT